MSRGVTFGKAETAILGASCQIYRGHGSPCGRVGSPTTHPKSLGQVSGCGGKTGDNAQTPALHTDQRSETQTPSFTFGDLTDRQMAGVPAIRELPARCFFGRWLQIPVPSTASRFDNLIPQVRLARQGKPNPLSPTALLLHLYICRPFSVHQPPEGRRESVTRSLISRLLRLLCV
jgi:hypothetical protein